MENYLDRLDLTHEERSKLLELAIDSPIALFRLIEAHPTAFAEYVGKDEANKLRANLIKLIPKEQLAVTSKEPRRIYRLGANPITKKPELMQPRYNLSERDELFRELQHLKSQEASTDGRVTTKISELTSELNKMLSK